MLKLLLSKARVFWKGAFHPMDVAVADDRIIEISPDIPFQGFDRVLPLAQYFLFPGFVDVHVHLREPGFFYKETIATGTRAAARGGYTAVCAMPNLDPPPDSVEHLERELQLIRDTAVVDVYPYACITKGQTGHAPLSLMEDLASSAIAFSDDGRGVQDADSMRRAMTKAAGLHRIIAAHCEDNAYLPKGGCMHDGAYARAHGLTGIPSICEFAQVERDLRLAKETGCAYHVCHVSCKESVQLIRQAKKEGVNVTCETAPHYLCLNENDLQDDGRFKMNPPLRGREDQEAILEGVKDGTIDMIATDHAPHSAQEKSRGLKGSLMGVSGLEAAFPILYTRLVKPGLLDLAQLLRLMSTAPRRRFGFPMGLQTGGFADLTVWDLNASSIIDPQEFQSLGRATPFEGEHVLGRCKLTLSHGKIAWEER